MDFSKRQADPRRHLTGIVFVVLFHGLLVYGLMSGLARKVIDVVRAPIETKVIEEVTKPPPPPEVVLPPPPKLEAPPPPFIPPPEVQIATPPPPAPTITATTPTPPVQTAIVPVAPPVAAPAPPAPPVAAPSVGVSCPGYKQVLQEAGIPREAVRAQLESGEVILSFTIGVNGEVKNVAVIKSTNRAFNRGAIEAVSQFKCQGQGQEVNGVQVTASYRTQ